MVQTGMSTPYTAFAQNGGPGASGDASSMKSDMKEGVPPGGGGGGGSPTALHVLQQSAQHVNGVVDQQQNAVAVNILNIDNEHNEPRKTHLIFV